MGSNYSTTVEDTKAHNMSSSSSNTIPVTFVHPIRNHSNNYNNNSFRQRSEPTAAAAALAVVQPSMAARSGIRIHAFHSRASWSGYLEATKAFNYLVVVYFATMWEEACRYMEPIVKEFAAIYTNIEFVKIDADELRDISHKHGVGTTPTFVFVKKGKVIDKVVGARKDELQSKIEKHML